MDSGNRSLPARFSLSVVVVVVVGGSEAICKKRGPLVCVSPVERGVSTWLHPFFDLPQLITMKVRSDESVGPLDHDSQRARVLYRRSREWKERRRRGKKEKKLERIKNSTKEKNERDNRIVIPSLFTAAMLCCSSERERENLWLICITIEPGRVVL